MQISEIQNKLKTCINIVKENKIFAGILTTIIVLGIYSFLYKNFSYNFILRDDLADIDCFRFIDILKTPKCGHYFATFFDRLFIYFLPNWFNIHPSHFKSVVFSVFEAISIICCGGLLNSIANKKFDYFYAVTLLLSLSALIFFISESIWIVYLYEGFFRMLLPTFFLIGLIILLCRNNKNWTLTYIFTILAAISSEMMLVITIVGLFIYFLISKSNKKQIFSLFLISLLSSLFIFLSGGFIRHLPNNSISLFDQIASIIRILPDFIQHYIKYIVIKHIVLYFILFIQLLLLFWKYENKSELYKKLKVLISFGTGCLMFFFSLICAGKETYYVAGEYWLYHPELHIIYNIILLSFSYMLLKLIVSAKIINKELMTIIFIPLSYFCIYQANIKFYDFVEHAIKPLRKITYQFEKIVRHANINNKTAYISKDLFLDDGYYMLGEYMHITYSSKFTPDKYAHCEENVECTSIYLHFFDNYKNQSFEHGYIFTNPEKADNEFKNNRGSFSEEELNNINFNNLYKFTKTK